MGSTRTAGRKSAAGCRHRTVMQIYLVLPAACTIFATKVIIYRKNETRKTIIMLEKGLSARSAATVAAGNTAAAMGSGDLAVFATPAMVALMENAAMTAVAGELPEGATTVGSEMNVTHIKPSGLGAEITATAVLAEVEGRKLTFNVGARDAEGLIGEGIHIRYIVDREKFMAKVK
mgnify:FL=1